MGKVETQQHKTMVTQHDQRMSMLPRVVSLGFQPVTWTPLLEEFAIDDVTDVVLSSIGEDRAQMTRTRAPATGVTL